MRMLVPPMLNRVIVKRVCATCATIFFAGLDPGGVPNLPTDCPKCRRRRNELW